MKEEYKSLISNLPFKIRRTLEFSEIFDSTVEEIRLRAFKPAAVTVNGETLFINKNGNVSDLPDDNSFIVSASDISDAFNSLCNNSVFSHDREIARGFISLDGGHRVGICGTFLENGDFCDITSLNIRIANRLKNVSASVPTEILKSGVLVAGPPGSGKTSFLRDCAKRLSSGKESARVAVIDTRNELFSSDFKDLGENCDVLKISDKRKGIETALRILYPQIVIFDEIGSISQAEAVTECFNSGISVITSAHAGGISDLKERKVIKILLDSGAVKNAVLLSPAHRYPPRVIPIKDI